MAQFQFKQQFHFNAHLNRFFLPREYWERHECWQNRHGLEEPTVPGKQRQSLFTDFNTLVTNFTQYGAFTEIKRMALTLSVPCLTITIWFQLPYSDITQEKLAKAVICLINTLAAVVISTCTIWKFWENCKGREDFANHFGC